MLDELRVHLGHEVAKARQQQHEHSGAVRAHTLTREGLLTELSAEVDRRSDLPESDEAYLPMEQARAVREMLEALDDRLRQEVTRMRQAHTRTAGYADGMEAALGIVTAFSMPVPPDLAALARTPGT